MLINAFVVLGLISLVIHVVVFHHTKLVFSLLDGIDKNMVRVITGNSTEH